MNQHMDELRQQMVKVIERSGIRDQNVLKSMSIVPRHIFVDEERQIDAYKNYPLPIGEGQVITQPSLVARMVEAAHIDQSSIVLEIGTGSGYAAAVLSRIAQKVYTIERISSFVEVAKKRFLKLGYNNILVKTGDGSLGWPEKAPFDAMIISAGAPSIPKCYINQLKVGGRLVIPVGGQVNQDLVCLHKRADGTCFEEIIDYVRFVPLIGQEGWSENNWL
jgi:protein-L-isoaspartate(D-aspartate) O-methyltransferase